MYLIIIIAFFQLVRANIIWNNKSVVCLGGPGTHADLDIYNSGGNWNRTYHPGEPQQIHATWVANGVALKVQFSTMVSLRKSIMQYWSEELENIVEIDSIVESLDWEFEDEGIRRAKQYMHVVTTKQLDPSRIYKYRIITVQHDELHHYSDTFEIHTPEKYSNSFKFLATGDIGLSNSVSMPILKDLAHGHDYDFVAIMGDQGYDLGDFNGTKGDQYLNYAQELYANLPVLTTAGNHEQLHNFSHYKHRFDLLPYRESNFENSLQYSINYKSLHLISFSTEVFFEGSEAEAMTSLNWLEQDLIKANRARSRVPWIIVIGHRPLYCSIADDDDCTKDAELLRFGYDKKRGLETLLTKYNVDLYLCGHKHNYERTFPVRNNKLVTESYHNSPQFFQLITGNSGNYNGPEAFKGPIHSWSARRYQNYGLTGFEVSPNHIHIRHYESKIDGSIGGVRDFVRVSKTKSHIHKQKIIHE